jgi:hypothetical protein
MSYLLEKFGRSINFVAKLNEDLEENEKVFFSFEKNQKGELVNAWMGHISKNKKYEKFVDKYKLKITLLKSNAIKEYFLEQI